MNNSNFFHWLIILLSFILVLIPSVSATCTCENEAETINKSGAFMFKLVAIIAVLLAGSIGLGIPILGRKLDSVRPENDVFFMIKAFAAGVILATGYIHILPDAFDTLTSPCVCENRWWKFPFVRHADITLHRRKRWWKFPFAGFLAMMASIVTLMLDTLAHSLYKNMHFNKSKQVSVDEEGGGNDHDGHVHVHTHATHGHAHGASVPSENLTHIVRQRIISQVLELGIVVHSVIIGISRGF